MELIKIQKENIGELDAIMEMIYDEWGGTFSSSKEEKLQKIKNEIIKSGAFPKVYLLKQGQENIGSFSILEHELKGSDLSPWLACVVISKKYRGKGYGAILLGYIKSVIESNYSEIYLTTDMVGFYEKIGFKLAKTIDNNGKNNRLYLKITNI